MKHLLLLFLIAACATVNQPLKTDVLYRKDITFWVNGKKIKGVGVATLADSYKIYIEYPQGKIDLLSIKTCHREIPIEDEGSKATYIYKPNGIEMKCPVDIGIYHKKGRHGWGYLLFESPLYTLKAQIQCNGEAVDGHGVSVCQGDADTVQRITFKERVSVASQANCPLRNIGDDFEYTVHPGFCKHSFMNAKGEIHNHLVIGYDTFIIGD